MFRKHLFYPLNYGASWAKVVVEQSNIKKILFAIEYRLIRVKNKKFILLILVEALCLIYLVWWYFWSPYYGYYEANYNDLIAFVLIILLLFLTVFISVRTFFKKKKRLYLLILPFVWFLIFFDVFRSPVIFFHQQTDFSVTERIRLRKNGTYDILRVGQHYTYYSQGKYTCKGNSIILSKGKKFNNDSVLMTLTKGNTVTFKGFGYLSNHTIKETDRQYSKLKLIEYGWLR